MSVLDQINRENDIKKIPAKQYGQLADEIRAFLVENVSKTGGHLASNLGAVELTMALHLVLDLPNDKLIWDVGHQSYTHKILTGRKDDFPTLRQMDGISGFPRRAESECDCFDTGHSSTSVSVGLGFATARDLLGESYNVVSVIGDGALTGGLAYEALNNASKLNSNFIIVINDNHMSISENVGGMAGHLASLRTAEAYQEFKSDVHSSLARIPYGERVARRIHNTKSGIKQLVIPGMIFENMGLTYLGPVSGHNIYDMVRILNAAKKVKGAVVVHVVTEKGKGYSPAERRPERFHGIGPFDAETGREISQKKKPDYTDVFSTVICKIAEKNEKIVALTAAMAEGTGLKRFRAKYPDRFFDVGIAEEHAVTFAAGMAASGLHPFFAVYSSFLQRAFDEMIHDVCLQKLPVTFAVDRAGLVGRDGETHQGIMDISYLSMMPNMTVMAPKNKWELSDMLWFCSKYEGPAAIRYPRGEAWEGLKEYRAPIEYGKSEWIFEESGIAIFAVGNMAENALLTHNLLEFMGIESSLVNARFVKPIDSEAVEKAVEEHSLIVTIEENILRGGYGESVEKYISELGAGVPVLKFGIEDRFVQHGSVEQLRECLGLDASHMADRIMEVYRGITGEQGTAEDQEDSGERNVAKKQEDSGEQKSAEDQEDSGEQKPAEDGGARDT